MAAAVKKVRSRNLIEVLNLLKDKPVISVRKMIPRVCVNNLKFQTAEFLQKLVSALDNAGEGASCSDQFCVLSKGKKLSVWKTMLAGKLNFKIQFHFFVSNFRSTSKGKICKMKIYFEIIFQFCCNLDAALLCLQEKIGQFQSNTVV